ncbi:hypothetical protein KF5_050 [Vibrio phage vB_VpaS_KF5]|nr:hypothetical protein [Vibrio alginolyticus]ATI19360.1 hypothetical protein KF5_050 [Vibrio phage vB_VpaS_KF5]ATI19454.1 hypothetical protein KF6_046 [Vibrio phage vB_VpaS_KF6]AUM58752.1 hypothetical protein VVP001_052 [Vibrio phage VVP001]QEP53419.1 hypothetical protein HCMJ_51 [Vibrio phage vB_VpaS_HCMJ]
MTKMREFILLALSVVIALAVVVGMADPMVFGLLLVKTAKAVVALVAVRVAVHYLDKVIGVNFREHVRGWDGQAMAIYMGARFIGAAVLFGCIFS